MVLVVGVEKVLVEFVDLRRTRLAAISCIIAAVRASMHLNEILSRLNELQILLCPVRVIEFAHILPQHPIVVLDARLIIWHIKFVLSQIGQLVDGAN